MGGCLDDAERDRVHAYAMCGVFDRQRAAGSDETPFGEGGQRGGTLAVRVVDQGRGDVHDVPTALLDHLPDRPLGDVEEPGQVHGRDRGIVLDRVLRERFADVDTGVVDQRVDPPESIAGLVDRTLRGFGVSDVASNRDVFVVVRSRERARDADDGISGATVASYKACADALGRAGDDHDRRTHWTR